MQQNRKRVILVTGAAGGIGRSISAALVSAGHSVAAVDQDKMALQKFCISLDATGHGRHLLPIAADLAIEDDCAMATQVAMAHFAHVDGVINNVGIGVSSIRPDAEANHPRIEEINTSIWDKFFAINVRAAMLVTRAILPHMKAQNWGRIVNVTTSYRTMLRVLPYGATKSALESMSAVWAAELTQTGVTVNVLVPGGPTDTPLISDGAGWPREKMLRPDIMGPPASWLVSEEANLYTGKRITACDWDKELPGSEAASRAGRPIGWPELASEPRAWQSQT